MRGKMLRLDVDNIPEGKTYGIPPDNPFIDDNDTLPEIYALGLRQPWTVSVDPGDPETGEGAGRIFLADCGQKSYEEINLIVKGGNYGWSSREAHACYKYRYCGTIGPEEYPIISYVHDVPRFQGFCAIGGQVYHGKLNPSLKNAYIHGDTGLQGLFLAWEGEDGKWSHDQVPMCSLERCAELRLTNVHLANVVAFGSDSDGEMYLISTDTPDHTVYGTAIQLIIDPETYQPSSE